MLKKFWSPEKSAKKGHDSGDAQEAVLQNDGRIEKGLGRATKRLARKTVLQMGNIGDEATDVIDDLIRGISKWCHGE
jgi:hypothetical protein